MCLRLRLILIFMLGAYAMAAEEPHHTTAYIGLPGEVDLLLTYSTYSTDDFWNRHGKLLPTYNHFKKQSYLLYGEYVINCRNSISINGGYSGVEESLNGHSRGLEDVQLGWKYLLRSMPSSALTAQVIAVVPVGKTKSSIRYGRLGMQANLLYSHIFRFAKSYVWCDLGIGYRYYHGFPSDQIRAEAALGYQINACVQMIATSEFDYGLFHGGSKHNINNVVFHPNYRLLKAKLECVMRLFSHASLSVGAYKHFWGRNIGRGGGFFCGLWLDF